VTKIDFQQLRTSELIARFADNGVAQDQAIFHDANRKFAVLMKEMVQIRSEIERRGKEAQLRLMTLFDHSNIQVRLQAARATLFVAPVAARHQIEAIANSRIFPQAGDAGMTLVDLDRNLNQK
jgi:hypothetical protein